MGLIEELAERAKAAPQRVVFPEMDDPRTAEAARRLADEGLAEPVSLAEDDAPLVAALVEGRGIKEGVAAGCWPRPLFRAGAMVAAGQAAAMVAGAVSPTKRVIEAASLTIGLREGVRVPSSFFLMLFPDGRQLVLSDCGLNVSPDAETLADIARASAASARVLLGHAETAMLSYSTGASGAGESVERVARAAALAGVAGPVQGDAALNPEIAAKKGLEGGPFNTLIFPSLDAGNIAYKLLQELAGAQALGPILQGFARPVCDLSRGATADDIFAATLVSLALG